MGEASLLIRKVPNNTNADMVKRFIRAGTALRYKFFLKFTRVSMVTVINTETKETELQCVVTIDPGGDVDKMIKRLHARHLNGRRVFVKRYFERHSTNDRRQNRGASAPPEDDRAGDRRKNRLLLFGDATSKALAAKPGE